MQNYILIFLNRANSTGDFHTLRLTSAHCTLAMYPLFCNSIQLASNSFGPIRKLRSTILSSSLTSVAVSPSLQCACTMVRTRRNILAADKSEEVGQCDGPPHPWSYPCRSSNELTRNSVHLIEDHQPPFLAPHPFHYSLSLPWALGGVTQHGIGADGYGASDGLVLGVRSESAYLRVVNGGPHFELSLPLLHWHRGVAQYQTAFTNCARRCHANQRFTRS